MKQLIISSFLAILVAQPVNAQVSIGDVFSNIVRESIEASQGRDGRGSRASNVYDDMSRAELMDLQRALAARGHYAGAIDGQFGRGSRAAAAAYQRSIDSEDTGYLSPAEVQQLLAEADAKATTADATAPTSEPAIGMAGMPTRDGVVQLASGTNATLTEHLGGDYRAYGRRLVVFGKLLVLAGNPALLDAPESTGQFVSLIDIDRAAPYLDETTVRLIRDRGSYYTTSPDWAGDNQFAKEDSRQAFLAAFRDEIMAQVPKLPLRVDVLRGISYGAYAEGELEIEIDHHDVFPFLSGTGLAAPDPFNLPTRWALDADEARRVVEMVPADEFQRPIVVTRAVITGARPQGSGTILDIAAIDMQVYSSMKLDERVASIPLPPNAVTYAEGGVASAPDASALDGVPFDPLLVRMLISTERPEFADSDSFRFETFRMRRESEKRTRESSRSLALDWPLLVAPSLLSSNADPSADDIARVTEWFTEARATPKATATIGGLCWYERRDSDACIFTGGALGEGGKLALAKTLTEALGNWKYGWNGLPDDAHEMAQQAYPGNAGLLPFGAGRDVPGYLVLAAHPAWYEMQIPDGEINDAMLDVAIVRHQILGTPSGKGFFTIEIAPVALRLRLGDQWQTLPIETPAAPLVADRRFDMLGVKLGMPLAEAEAIIAKSFEGRNFEQATMVYESGRDPVFGQADPILGQSTSFRSPPYQYDSMPKKRGAEAIRLYYDALKPEKPIIAVGRYVILGEDVHSNDQERAVGQPVLESMISKYGPPDLAGKLIGNAATIWAADPTTKARLANGDESCELDQVMGSAHHNTGRFRSGLISTPCGEMLTAWFGFGGLGLFLTDTTEILALRQHHIDEATKAAEATKAEQPAISF